jgi:transposase
MSGFSKVKMSAFRICTFAISLADGLICWCLTQSQAAQLLHISERQIRRLLQKYKTQGPTTLAHAACGQTSNSKLSEELRLKCLNLIAEQFYGFRITLVHEKLTTVLDIAFFRGDLYGKWYIFKKPFAPSFSKK